MTGHYYYSTASDAPAGFSNDGTLGYIHNTDGSGLIALYRHHNSVNGDYLPTTSATPPAGYQLQATLGYLHTSSSGPTDVYQDLNYAYDSGGNITGIYDALWTGSRDFEYDDLNRLTKATGNFGPGLAEVTHNYAYDPIGNILQKNGIFYYYCDHPTQPAQPQDCIGPIHKSAVAATSDGRHYVYDPNGNTLTGAGRTFTWNIDNRVSHLIAPGGTVEMSYDYTGRRVKKSGGGGITYFPFSGYEVTSAGSDGINKYIRVGTEILAANLGQQKRFYHNDHLGGINVITDEASQRIQLTEYDPWGKVSRSEGTGDPNKRFTGKELDPESGLYYYGGRYYDPDLARFVSPDPFVGEVYDPQNLNRYSYVINNPQTYIDPSGYFHRHKTSGGFWNSIFGSILRIVFDIVLLINGVPAEGGFFIGIGAVADLAHASSNIINQLQAPNGSPLGFQTIAIPGLMLPSGGGFFSPSLILLARPGCDICEEPGWDLLRALLTLAAGVAEAAEIPKGSAGGPDAGKRHPDATKRAVRTGVCNICGDPTKRTPGPESSEIDHIIPRCKGGNCSVQNAQETCRTCNRDKGSLTMEQHIERLQREQQEINRINSLPPGERAGPLRELFRKRWQALLRWGGLAEEP
jgi:RHS repeat-associated protein